MPRLKLNTLPPAQQKTFEQLTFTREHFVLYGGTAVALLAGHRISMDFDFFGSSPVTEKDKQDILSALSLDKHYPRIQDSENTLSLRLPPQNKNDNGVLVSFFGDITKPRFKKPCAAETGPRVASPLDLAGFKLAMAYHRNKEDDLIDLAALFDLNQTMSEAARAMSILYPGQASLHHAVASAAWFKDRETSATGKLTNKIKTVLETAVKNYRETNTPLSIENPLLSAPGFEPALITRQNTSNTKESNRSPGG